jgi:hemerythrin-like domain-containing protein
MPDAMLLLQLEHNNTVRLLSVLERLCERLEAGEPPEHELLELVVEYFRGFPEECHHPKEDLIYRKLRHRDPEAAEAVGDLLDEHERLAMVTRQMATLTQKARHNGVRSEELANALRQFVTGYEHHLLQEERLFFPIALDKLTGDDWAAIDFGVFDQRDPLFDDATESRFRELREQIWASAAEDETPDKLAQGE